MHPIALRYGPSVSAQLREEFERYRTHPEFSLCDEFVDVNQPGLLTGDTILHIAARTGTLEDVKRLLSLGADVNCPGDMGFTALHEAARRGRPELVDLLLRGGADASVKNEWGESPMESMTLRREALPEEQFDAVAALLLR